MTYIKQAFARATPRKIRVLCSALNKPMPKYRPGTREVTVQYFSTTRSPKSNGIMPLRQ